ncbi:hypothetical protein [Alkalihalobacillus sp. CinArs1]|uniref:hypothetical protein n=1 Tax=Alkalihalobacillus sp. CinArs1 TaxID=2995314 RepID=UPI0022DD85D5|nr:hypothetical protein [Alkalihalobacillus sp. CinArs1]
MIWVMTQNLESFVNVKEITVKDNMIEGVIERRFFIEWKKTLGTFESNERALEVLKELYNGIDERVGNITKVVIPLK